MQKQIKPPAALSARKPLLPPPFFICSNTDLSELSFNFFISTDYIMPVCYDTNGLFVFYKILKNSLFKSQESFLMIEFTTSNGGEAKKGDAENLYKRVGKIISI